MKPDSERAWLEAEGIRPSKRLGQNFLLDRKVCALIAARAGWREGDQVFEIGPGAGALTRELLAAGLRIHAVEKDARLIPILRDRFHAELETGRLSLEEADALELDWLRRAATLGWIDPAAARANEKAEIWLAGNLPYTITTPLLLSALSASSRLAGAVFMVQREYGDRLASSPGTKSYGSITVWTRAHGSCRTLLRVGRSAFWPRPGVESSVVEIAFPAEPPVPTSERPRLERLLRAAFAQRRKTLLNTVSAGWPLPKDEAARCLERAAIDRHTRAERLDLDAFVRLSTELGRLPDDP